MPTAWTIFSRTCTFLRKKKASHHTTKSKTTLNFPFFIARRYLLSKRKKNFINVISIISVISVAIISAAIIIVLSIFNGLGDLLHVINNSFDPEIKIEASAGKTFEVDQKLIKKIKDVPGVKIVTEVIEDYAYARYNDATQVVKVKGVSDNFVDQDRIPKESIVEGELLLKKNGAPRALVGYGVRSTLSIALEQDFFALQLYGVKSLRGGATMDPSKMYTQKSILPGGVFSIIQSFDENYVIVPLEFAKELLSYKNRRTSLEIKMTNGANPETVEDALQDVLGKDFLVLNGEEQHQDLYRVLKLEKLFASVAAILLLVIGSINIYFSLMMLALDKKRDITILAAMGADGRLLKKIFITEGILIAAIGTGSGLLFGGLILLLQQQFSLVSMGMNTAVVDGYPVKMLFSDFFYVFSVMAVVTLLISSRPAALASRFASVQNL
ncbi:ABC transporter permease [Chryseolinea lacunae]|uniref:ABC transporter permease n=1 Tax=Chryseolinea lacunae TaxID=2801331 RepID=A0ABS1KRI6_9BACT|nr:FtsX-like permease family protein [Chryseolinea lacunae]MBL0741808.1 ABC transporter permease [Chryseolinea lacunae]